MSCVFRGSFVSSLFWLFIKLFFFIDQKKKKKFPSWGMFIYFRFPGSDSRPKCRNSRRAADEAVHEEGPGEGVGQSEPEGEAGDPVAVRARRREDEDAAGDRRADGCKQGENQTD